jgi:uncharacterized repeat protein (TIGR02543 family)
MPSDPTRSGHLFGGWYTQLNGGGAAFTASTVVSANTKVYAKWTDQYTVTFDADGGSPATQTRTVNSGEAVGSAMPSDPTRSGDIFGGWYTQQNGGGAAFTASTTVTANITVYAKWREDAVPSGLTLEESLTWLSENAMNGSTYTITLSGDENIGSETLSYGGKLVTIILNGKTAERTVSLSSNGELFSVESGVTLRLGDNITLWGRSGNTSALIQVDSGATLEMVSGSKISGNTFYNGPGGGVFVNSGTFTMNGGEISGNTADNGGGVYVDSGTFTMDGGEISGNTAERYGGGVFVNSGTFTKQSGGVIYGSDANDTLENTGSSGGHAVYVSGGKQYNSTAGEGVTLDSTKEWGWE